jgi:hypothetical protein
VGDCVSDSLDYDLDLLKSAGSSIHKILQLLVFNLFLQFQLSSKNILHGEEDPRPTSVHLGFIYVCIVKAVP